MRIRSRHTLGPHSASRRLRALAAAALVALAIAAQTPRVLAQGGRTIRLASVGELPASTKRWALVIGVDEYTDEQITGLRGAANDAQSLASALVSHAGFPADQVIVLATGEPDSRLPTRTNILKRLSNLSAVVPKDGLLLVSFSGHGMERGGQAFLLPSDATAANDVGLLEETAISVVRMHDRIRATGVGQVLVLLDACRNDPTTGRADSTNALTTAYTRGFNFDVANREVEAYATLYATSVGARAYEYVEKRQGYFTWAVVEGLKGAAADSTGRVTLAGLIRHIEQAVPKRVGVDYGAGKLQRPFARIEGYRADELVVAIAASPVAAPGAAAPPPAPVVVDPKVVEIALWNAIESSRDAADFEDYLKQYPSGSYAGVARAKIKQLRASGSSPGESLPVRPAERAVDVVVQSTIDWTNSKVRVKRGDLVRVVATGKVRLSKESGQTGPAGTNSPDSGKLIGTGPTGGLIAVVGDDNDDFLYLGAEGQFVSQHDGVLFFSVNEGFLKDNEGQFKVTVTIAGRP